MFTRSKEIKKLTRIVFGGAILAFGIYNIHSRCEISEGGVLGLSLLIFHWWNISPGISCFIMDVSAMLLGAFVLKSGFMKYSIIASASYSLWYRFFEALPPMLPYLGDMPAAAAIAGGLFVGVGAGLIVRHDCAAGGDDSLALVFHKLTGMKVSLFYVLSDFTVLMLSLSYIPFRKIGWSMLSVLISSAVIELLRPKENV